MIQSPDGAKHGDDGPSRVTARNRSTSRIARSEEADAALRFLLLRQLIDLLIHFIGRLHDARIRFIGALALNQIDKGPDHIDVRLLGISLRQRARPSGPPGFATCGSPEASVGKYKLFPMLFSPPGF